MAETSEQEIDRHIRETVRAQEEYFAAWTAVWRERVRANFSDLNDRARITALAPAAKSG